MLWTQLAAQNFAHVGTRQIVTELHNARGLVASQIFAAEGNDVFFCQVRITADDIELDDFARFFIGNPHGGGFDTLSWREPVETAGRSATESELLPILVAAPLFAAAPADKTEAEAEAEPERKDEIIDLAAVARSAS